jgi:tRNA(Ile)-lysidine synthase
MANSKNWPATEFLAKLDQRLRRHVTPGQRLCVALSGGVDSIALLHATAALADRLELGFLRALHVHHGLSPNADKWETFCRQYCDQAGVPMESRRVEVSPDGGGIEAAARSARYAVLESTDCDWVVLGHHRDDQAETVMLNLLRGSGVHGAAGMAEVRGRLLRPLLDFTRGQIVAYARQAGLSWVEDESNEDSSYRRNFLRREIIPELEKKFPQAVANLARAASAFAGAAELLDQIAHEDLGSHGRLHIEQLKNLSPLRASNLLAYYLRRHGLQIPGNAALLEMLRQLLGAANDRQVFFAIGKHEVRRFRGQVLVELPSGPVEPLPWRGQESVDWGGRRICCRAVIGAGISAALLDELPLLMSPRRGGEVLQLRENGPRRPLKDLLREAAIPPWQRNNLPVLFAGKDIVWVAGVGIARQYRCNPGAKGILIEFDGVTW